MLNDRLIISSIVNCLITSSQITRCLVCGGRTLQPGEVEWRIEKSSTQPPFVSEGKSLTNTSSGQDLDIKETSSSYNAQRESQEQLSVKYSDSSSSANSPVDNNSTSSAYSSVGLFVSGEGPPRERGTGINTESYRTLTQPISGATPSRNGSIAFLSSAEQGDDQEDDGWLGTTIEKKKKRRKKLTAYERLAVRKFNAGALFLPHCFVLLRFCNNTLAIHNFMYCDAAF